jgi:putative peptidoglycan lipid II flippase
VVTALAVGAKGADPVSSYAYAYAFLQFPYGVVAISVMTRVTPELSAHWATGNIDQFKQRFVSGLRSMLAIILPSSVGMLLLAIPASDLLLAHGATSANGTANISGALAMFALGLPGFCTYLYVVRALQSMQHTQTAFWLYLIENSINVLLALALVGPMGVRGLALSLSIAYTVAAVGGLVVLRHWLGPLGDRVVWRPTLRVAVGSLVMAVPVAVASNLSTATQGVGLVVRVLAGAGAGAVVFVGVAAMWAGRVDGRQAVRRSAPQ